MTTGEQAEIAARAAVEAVDEQEQPGPVETYELSTGIVLRFKSVPPMTVRAAAMRILPPLVPSVYLEDRDREEPNPNDPDYQKALHDWEDAQNLAAGNVALLMGTSVESVPEGMFRPEDDGWMEPLEVLEIPLDVSRPSGRYLAWLQHYALASPTDLALVTSLAMMRSGLTEAELQRAVDSFRNRTVGRADNGATAEQHGSNGHQIPRAARRPRSRNGRA